MDDQIPLCRTDFPLQRPDDATPISAEPSRYPAKKECPFRYPRHDLQAMCPIRRTSLHTGSIQGKYVIIVSLRNNVWLCVFPAVRARARNRNRFLELCFLISFDYDYEHRPRRTEHEHDSAGARTPPKRTDQIPLIHCRIGARSNLPWLFQNKGLSPARHIC
jgi:hypothetical protein